MEGRGVRGGVELAPTELDENKMVLYRRIFERCAAERMAAEIARLKAELEKFQLVATSCNDEANISQITRMVNRAIGEGREGEGSDLYWAQCWCLLREIKHLKAELEKRPEVVRCGECKKKDLGFACPLVCANTVIKAKTKVENFILFDDNDFCSAGQRRESEGKNNGNKN